MAYQIVFYNHKVEAEILNWPTGIVASFSKIAQRIEEYGPNIGMPFTNPMGDGIFEIRARGIEGIGRGLFCLEIDQKVIILHAFIKKTPKTPKEDLDLARTHLKELRNEKNKR